MIEATSISGRVVITGGTGFLGLNLAGCLAEQGCEVVLISRHLPVVSERWRHEQWDGYSLGSWVDCLDGATALVNLAGRTVDCVKTPNHCDEILRSRVAATEVLGRAVREVRNPPGVWVQMSTAHVYGDPPEVICDEGSSFGYGIAPFVGRAWERAFEGAVIDEMRSVVLRTSFVLGRDGGALPRLAKLVRWGLGGKVGDGKQGISWIHQADMNRLFVRAITCDGMRGAYLATAPKPVSNDRFMGELRGALGVWIGLPAMEWMVRLGAPLVMRTDPELALYGRYCISRRLRDEGYEFVFEDITSALRDLYGRS